MDSPNDKPANKFNINFSGPTNIGHQQVGDVYTNNYDPVSNMTITIDNRYIQQMPKEYRESLLQFIEKVNTEINKENIPPDKGAPFQTSINGLAEITTKMRDGNVPTGTKETVRERLKEVAKSLVRMSPNIARVALGFTPLAPFSNLAGDAFEKMVQVALQ